MVIEEWSECPECKFPALYSDFKRVVENSGTCPMCYQAVSNIQRINQKLQLKQQADEKAAPNLSSVELGANIRPVME